MTAPPQKAMSTAEPTSNPTPSSAFPPSPLASSTFLPRTPHYETGHYISPHTFLPDASYAQCLDSLTKACCDLLLTHRSTFLLAHRTQYPQRSWWYACGGRTRPGESLHASASRLLTRELGLPLSPADLLPRMASVGHYSYAWEMRAQRPIHHGTADIAVLASVELSDAEKAVVDAGAGGEDGERRWLSAEDILAGDYHPAVHRGIRDWVTWRAYRDLDEALQSGADEREVTRAARTYVERMRLSRTGEEATVHVDEKYLPEDEADAAKRRKKTEQ